MHIDIDNDDLMILNMQCCDLYRWFSQHWLSHDDASLLAESTLANFYYWLPDGQQTTKNLWAIAQHHLDLHNEGATDFPERYEIVNDRMSAA